MDRVKIIVVSFILWDLLSLRRIAMYCDREFPRRSVKKGRTHARIASTKLSALRGKEYVY